MNDGRFEDIEFVFEDFFNRLKKKTLSSCEITWCHSRHACKYVDVKSEISLP